MKLDVSPGAMARLTLADEDLDLTVSPEQRYSEEQPRDEHGRWSDGGGSPPGEAVVYQVPAAQVQQWADRLPQAARDAMVGYTGRDHQDINTLARTGKLLGNWTAAEIKEVVEHTELLDAAIDTAPPLGQAILYRGMGPGVFTGKPEGPFKENQEFDWHSAVGREFLDKGFPSTSYSREVVASKAPGFVNGAVLELHLAGEVRGAPLYKVSLFDEEKEILLERGLKFHVDEVRDAAPSGYGASLGYQPGYEPGYLPQKPPTVVVTVHK